ncbi:hypothetical protein K2173_028408 [Erythroxylum novogranatense]|uniref:Pentatricopeptide repeat-containing protein n=1 Tax=Erythroxylum novogranatense TaxID=1862640 RepID=A0AAV8U1S3_9ROSI|nr:hypothetical protein K2173_028408 [Erythroxylum novogranatense]
MTWTTATVGRIVGRTELHRFEDAFARVITLCNSSLSGEGVCVHSAVTKLGLADHMRLNNNLLSLYAKCFGLELARQFFDEMPYKDVVSWTGMVSAYVHNARHEDALGCFESMVTSGQCPNEFTFSSILRSCSALGEVSYGKRIHGSIVKRGLESNQVLGSALIELYSKFGSCEEASELFGYVENGDTVSRTTMISSVVEAGDWRQALRFYMDMIRDGVSPNRFTFTKLLTVSGFLGLICIRLIHAHMIKLGIELNLVLKTALVNAYSICKSIEDALRVSNLTPERDVFLWTAIISGFAQNSMFKEAVEAFQEMEILGILPNNFTYSSILNASASMQSLDLGLQIKSRVIKAGLEDDLSVCNSIIDMYMRCSPTVEDGLRVFRGMESPNVISWTSLIAGFANHGLPQDSLQLLMDMRHVGVHPNSFTLSTILRACSIIKSASETLKLHGYIIKRKADSHLVVNNALVDAYAGSGRIDDAWLVIRNMKQRDAITYTSLATRLNQMGRRKEALSIIHYMLKCDVKMDGFSLASFLSASVGLEITEAGKQLHCHSVKSGLGNHMSVSNSLVDFYGKYGLVNDARRAFAEIIKPDVVSWNSLMSGLALNGHISSALSAFEDMRLAGVKPDSVTFLLVLLTCSRGGLTDMGVKYFHSMREIQGLEPQMDHYVCLVDLLGRVGRLEEAMEVLETMPFMPDVSIYKTLLVSCKVHGNVPLGEDMARRGLEIDPTDPAFYLLLADLYHDSGRADLGEETRRLMRLKKQIC